MTQRFQLDRTIPEGFKAVRALETHVRSTLDHTLYELVKLRASILNGCAYCVDMHGTDLLGTGQDPRRVLAVAAWRDAPFFDRGERAALALTDAVTLLGDQGVPDDVWSDVVEHHGETGAANLTLAVATINVWNRLMITSRTQPPALDG